MGRLMEIIKNEHKDSVLYFDGGDQFQGGIESSQLTSNGEIIADFFNILGMAGSSIGNH